MIVKYLLMDDFVDFNVIFSLKNSVSNIFFKYAECGEFWIIKNMEIFFKKSIISSIVLFILTLLR